MPRVVSWSISSKSTQGSTTTPGPMTLTLPSCRMPLGTTCNTVFTPSTQRVWPAFKRVGRAVGVDSIEAECLPEEKQQELEYLLKRGHRTLVVGDGINDGPILAAADVGVAMGLSGSDIATNSAGVALMNDDLRNIPFLLQLAHKTRNVIAQNIGASLLLAIVGLALAATGNINIWAAPLLYAFGYVIVIANSMRLVRFGEEFTQQEHGRLRLESGMPVKPTRFASLSTAR